MAKSATQCPRCGAEMVEIDVASGDGHVVMQSCSACDGRWWKVDGEPAPLAKVLGRVRPGKKR